MSKMFSDAELIAFLDESLSPERPSEIEKALPEDQYLKQRLIEQRGLQAAGIHTLGNIWQRSKASCPSRDELHSFIKDELELERTEYIRFHLNQIGCRYCQANCADLLTGGQPEEQKRSRQRRFFQTSAGYLRANPDDGK